MQHAPVLLLPDWKGAGPLHWQTHWHGLHGYPWVEQHDWQQPLRGDWISRLEDVLLDQPAPPVLVACGLGCLLVAAWASVSRNPQRVRAALLVTPLDSEIEALRPVLKSWAPITQAALPFPSTLVPRANDPHCSPCRALALAQAWGSTLADGSPLQAESALGAWPQGHSLLQPYLT